MGKSRVSKSGEKFLAEKVGEKAQSETRKRKRKKPGKGQCFSFFLSFDGGWVGMVRLVTFLKF